MRRAAILTLVVLGLAAPAGAQPTTELPKLENATPLFCKDDTGEIVPMQYASLGTVTRRYEARFQFTMSVNPDMTGVRFSNTDSDYYVSYKTRPYRDEEGHLGLAFLSMHVSLANLDEDINGTSMCYFTQFGK